jgi:hypothetical protein
MSKLDDILMGIENESDLITLRTKLKDVEKKLKEQNKPKTITVSAEVLTIQ